MYVRCSWSRRESQFLKTKEVVECEIEVKSLVCVLCYCSRREARFYSEMKWNNEIEDSY